MTATLNQPAPASTAGTAPNPPAPIAPAAPAHDDFSWDATPGQPIPAPPLFLLVMAEAGAGKTYLGCTFPGPVVCLDSEHRADRVLRKFRNTYWKKILTFDDVRRAVLSVIKKHSRGGTILFDSGSDLNGLAEEEVIAEMNASKAKVHPTLHWTAVYEKIAKMCGLLRERGWNAVFTARLGDEYQNDKKTGQRAPSGFVVNKLLYHADFAVELVVRDGKRIAKVLKNGEMKPGTYAVELPDDQISYDGIVKAMSADPIPAAPAAVGARAIQPAAAAPVAPASTAAAALVCVAVESKPVAPAPVAPVVPSTPATPADVGAMIAEATVKGEAIASAVLAAPAAMSTAPTAPPAAPILTPEPAPHAPPPAGGPGVLDVLEQETAKLAASDVEIAELEVLAKERWGCSKDILWARLMSKGWATERGKLTLEYRNKIRALLLARDVPPATANGEVK
jgi:hypothetical protein